MKSKKRRRKNELDRPIYVGSIPIKGTAEEQQELNEIIEQAAIEKLPLLMERYGIDEGDYFTLALALARKHEPGFQVVQAKLKLKQRDDYGNWGAVIHDTKPTKWSPKGLRELLNAVEKTKERHRATDRDALKILMRQPEWSRSLDQDEQKRLKTLQNRLADARRIKQGREPSSSRYRALGGAAELEEAARAARLAIAAESPATAYATLPVELRFTALCLPFSIEQESRNLNTD